jgi:hypothetical protein
MLSTPHLATDETMPFVTSNIGRHSTPTVTMPSVSPTSAVAKETLCQVISSELFGS